MNILSYIFVLVPLIIIDGIWLATMGGAYKKWLGHLFASTVNVVPVVFFYLFYALGVLYFVVDPVMKGEGTLVGAFFKGAFLGLIAYSTYDLTNNATLRDWPVVVTIVDMLWGAVVTGLASVIAVALIRYFK